MTAECHLCGAPAERSLGDGQVCADCYDEMTGNRGTGGGSADENPTPDADESRSTTPDWHDLDYSELITGEFPPHHLDREQGMARVGKLPFAPWADQDAPVECTKRTCREHDLDEDPDGEIDDCPDCQAHRDGITRAECDHDARWKWGYEGNYTTGEQVKQAEDDPRVDGHAFIQQHDDPFVFVDGDDVRDPETGDVHPAFLDVLEQLGMSYADVSTSGAGLHAYYRGELPDGIKQVTEDLEDEPWGSNDDPPTLEIYDGKHVCVVTGEHVAGTPVEVPEWDEDGLEAVLDEYVPDEDRHEPTTSGEHDAPLLDEYEPSVTGDETTTDVRDVYHAVNNLRPMDVRLRTHRVGSDATGWEKWDPSTYRSSSSGESLHRPPGESVFYDHKTGHGFGVLRLYAAEQGIISKPWHTLQGEEWWEAVEQAREDGAPIPEFDPPDDERRSSHQFPIQECEPTISDREPFDREQHWQDLQDRVEQWADEGGIRIFADEAGSGKTTNAARAADHLEEDHSILFDKHEKAREFQQDDVTPDGYLHLRGAEQKRHDRCMDADHAGEECPEHGHPSDCPSMCPVYDLPEDDEFRQLFEDVMAEVGPVEAHLLLEPHDGDECAFIEQFSDARSADRIVGVQEYARLTTVTEDRLTMIDEKPRSLETSREFSVPQLTQVANDLSGWAGGDEISETLRNLGGFVRDAVGVMIGEEDAPDTLDGLTVPELYWDSYEAYNDVAGDHLAYAEPEEPWQLAEALAQAKIRFHETILRRIREDDWDGTPLAFDAVIGMLIEAGGDVEAGLKAIAAPMSLDTCPRCHSDPEFENGRRVCTDCGWDEAEDTILTPDRTPARATVELERGDDPRVVFRSLPLPEDLPEDVLVLDATATVDRIDALFNADGSRDVEIEGEANYEVNSRVVQIPDGQYHYRTILQSERIQERIQTAIDTAGRIHDRPLIVLRQGLKAVFDFPDNAEVMHYHAVRGLNRDECDAVMCIGAPHPDVESLQQEAELLSMHRDDLRVGGEEYSTRRDKSTGELAANPPIYRKMNYEDDDGKGRAVPTKAFSGLTGELFREGRQKELEQTIHRIRPLLADQTKDVYLLTNVPTKVPVDEIATLDELTAPLAAFLPVSEGAVRLLEYVNEAEAGNAPDGFRASQLIERDEDGDLVFNRQGFHRLASLYGEDVTYRTVCNWVEDLSELGVIEPGEYEHREGVRFSVDGSTLKSVLTVLSRNSGFKVPAVRRLSALARSKDRSLRWLEWARDALGVTGEVSCLDPSAPPPG